MRSASDLICISGGIGAGKSVVSRILRTLGRSVYDCDLEARRIMEESPEIKRELCRMIGSECVSATGKIDRRRVASRVFADEVLLQWLNQTVHRHVRDDLGRWVEERQAAGEASPVFVESAIPVVSGLDRMCKRVWVVEAPEDVRIERAMARGNASLKDICARIETQRREYEGLPSDKVRLIRNFGSHSLLQQLELLLSEFPSRTDSEP